MCDAVALLQETKTCYWSLCNEYVSTIFSAHKSCLLQASNSQEVRPTSNPSSHRSRSQTSCATGHIWSSHSAVSNGKIWFDFGLVFQKFQNHFAGPMMGCSSQWPSLTQILEGGSTLYSRERVRLLHRQF